MSKSTPQSKAKTTKSNAIIGVALIAILFASGITFLQVLAFLMVLLMTIILSVFVFALNKSPDFAKTMIVCGAESKEKFIKKSHYGKSVYPWVWNISLAIPVFVTMFLFSPVLAAIMLSWKIVNDINFYKVISSDEFLNSLPDGEYDEALRKSETLKTCNSLKVKYKNNKLVMDFLNQIK